MAKGQGQRVNRSQLAAVFGISLPTVDAWVKAGAPYVTKGGSGKEWAFDTADVARWREERAANEASGGGVQDEAALKLRKLAADTRIVELEALQKMGELAPIADMERAITRVMAEMQGKLRGAFVTRAVSQLLGETDERTFKRVLLAEVDSALEVLAGMDVTSGDDDDESEDAADA
ncbi:terminase small subunit [Stenotrophomonas maltophilia]|uniref:terminase small subunit n=1 Tax=Stenotrophomonas maltophilia TaxID=40324 RepID=UPI002B1E57B7|nr:terminase small subunit [Stenotrophomonas maltophilia]